MILAGVLKLVVVANYMSLHRLIRLTSPNINYLIILGAIVFYCSAYTFFYQETSAGVITVVCNVSQ